MFLRISILLALTAAFPALANAESNAVIRDYSSRPSFVREPITARMTGDAGASQPSEGLLIFMDEADFMPHQVLVEKIIEVSNLPLVVLDAGYNKNIRPGMLCLVEQNGHAISLLVIAESDVTQAVGLIFSLADPATIQPGNPVRIKTVHFN